MLEPSSILLLLSIICFFVGFLYAFLTLRSDNPVRSRLTLAFMGGGFVLQSAFLYVRGVQSGRCPIANLPELLVFLCWAVVLYYFVIGSAFRLSLLGVFSYPLVVALQTIALILMPPAVQGESEFWRELHAALAVLSYGAFAMAGIAGVMFLVQHRHLKTRNLGGLFYKLPPIEHLSLVIIRLMMCGFVLLTIGIASAYKMSETPSATKLVLSYAVWAVYAGVLAVYWIKGLSSRHLASIAVGAFVLELFTLWLVSAG
jgi:HemX protein